MSIAALLWIALASSGPPADGVVAAEPVAAEVDVGDRVVVVRNPDPDLDARLLAELRFLGFTSEVVDVPVPRDVAALHDLARVHDAAAAIAIHDGGDRVTVWIGDRVTGKSVARALDPTQPDRAREIAVRTVELLRASLVELQHVPAAPEAEVASTTRAWALVRPAAAWPRMSTNAGPTASDRSGSALASRRRRPNHGPRPIHPAYTSARPSGPRTSAACSGAVPESTTPTWRCGA